MKKTITYKFESGNIYEIVHEGTSLLMFYKNGKRLKIIGISTLFDIIENDES